jgi:arylsulfatase
MSTTLPNILFVMVDQLGAATLDLYGGSVPSTPTLKRWAEAGTRFTRCYASVAVCAPNRATILTGRSLVAHGLSANNLELDLSTPTYAHALRAAGYRLGGFGKFHQTTMALPLPDDMSALGFDESVPTEDPRLGPWLTWVEEVHPEHYEAALATCWPMPYLSAAERERWQRAYDKYLQPLKDASPWPLMYTSPLPVEVQQTSWITDLGLDFMQRHLDEHPEKPFFCHLSYVDPHDPYDPPEPYASMFAPEAMPDPLPAHWLEHPPEALLKKRRFAGFERIAENQEALKQLQAYYHGSLRFIDDQLERLEHFLDDHGLWETTFIVFTSDHGEMLGDHGLITKGVTHYDKGIRCPLIVRGPEVLAGKVSKRLVCSLDFFPTFCDWAKMERRPLLEGKSFAAACRGDEAEGWTCVTVESDHCPDVHPSVRSIVTKEGWRLTVFDEEGGYGEMFDLSSDPHEASNLYFDRAWAEKKTALLEQHARAYMQALQVQQHRNLPVKDGRPHRVVQGLMLEDDVLWLRES